MKRALHSIELTLKNTWGTVNLAVNIGAWACPRDMTTWKRLNAMFKQNNVLARYFSGKISNGHLIERWNTRALVAFVEKSNWVCLVVAHLRERLLQSFGKYSVVGLEMRIRSPASVPRKNSNDPQNIDKKVQQLQLPEMYEIVLRPSWWTAGNEQPTLQFATIHCIEYSRDDIHVKRPWFPS